MSIEKENRPAVVDESPLPQEESKKFSVSGLDPTSLIISNLLTCAFSAIFEHNTPPRTLKLADVIAAGYTCCNSWAGLAATLFLGIVAGGPVTIIYGTIVVFVAIGCCTATLAELAARYPTAGGQYHWTWLLSPPSIRRGISYSCGIVNVLSWLTITASICAIIPSFILGLAATWNPGYVPQKWQAFLVYQASNIVTLVYNLTVLRRAPWTYDIMMVISLLCFLTFFIASLAVAEPKLSSSYVWATFVNDDSGWSNGVVFLTGLTNPNYMYAGLDGAIHLAEDALNASSAVPLALMFTYLIGFVTAFPFVVAMFYCISDPVGVLESLIPIFTIWQQATRSAAGATVMTVFFLTTGYFSLTASQQTASRLVWSFARDRALPFSVHIGTIHPTLGVPVWALLFNGGVVFAMGCIFIGSTAAFNGIVATALILMHMTFAIPAGLLLARGRDGKYLPEKGHWHMGAAGWLFNLITVAWALLVTVFYCFPGTSPTTGSTMNYASAVLVIMAICAAGIWFSHARHSYEGPRVDLERFRDIKR